MRLGLVEAQDKIHALAEDSKNIHYTHHARLRLRERSFSIRDAETILRKGIIIDEPRRGETGDWSYLVRYYGLEGKKREAACATIILQNDTLLIKTIEWVDPN
jgi:hypothetical protein